MSLFSGIKDQILSGHGDIRMLVTMSDKELSRINVIQSVVEKRMRRRDAARQLALTERQTQRLMNRFRGVRCSWPPTNLRRCGRPVIHRLPESLSCVFSRCFTITATTTLDQLWPRKNCANVTTSRCLLKRSENG